MERGFVALSLDDEEEEVVQVQREPDPISAEEDFWERGGETRWGNSYEGADLGRSKKEEEVEGGLGCRIDHILGMNLEGHLNRNLDVDVVQSNLQGRVNMDQDLVMYMMEGGDGKKRPRMESDKSMEGEEMGSLVVRNRRMVEKSHFISAVAKLYNPQVVFIMETKLSKIRMKNVRRKCGFLNGIDIEANGSRGGLCLAWKDNTNICLKSFSTYHIDVVLKENTDGKEWRFTGFYGSLYA
ncbi:hypothetical protein Godav_028224 [Gossypium davidsonii]|uniref:Uncharacterized protein n=1 Tax=Gossypium davidsonii TaxID=34287 RepID=A0A7J8RZ90_GOSDV|nr:hypothetical protein [Gossypium davidsonii]